MRTPCVQAAAVGLVVSVAAAATAAELVDIVQSPSGQYACFRVPSAIHVSGDTLVFLEARKHSCDDQAPKDIVVVRSSDQGASWSAPVVVVGPTSAAMSSNQTYRNPYAVVTATGTVSLQFVNSTIAEPWTSLQMFSGDAGKTWTAPTPMGAPVQQYDGILGGPGSPVLLGTAAPNSPYKGRIVSCGATGYHSGHAMEAALWYSDDGGRSWNLSSPTFPDMAECQAAERADGSVIVTFRARHLNATCDCRAHSVSHDGGETWSARAWDPQLVEPVCAAGLLGLGSRLYFSNPASRTKRVNMTLRWSDDGGATWPSATPLWPGPSAYSALVDLGAGTVGVAFERGSSGPYERVSFAVHGPASSGA